MINKKIEPEDLEVVSNNLKLEGRLYRIRAGVHLARAAEALCIVANLLEMKCGATFNGRMMIANPGDTPAEVLASREADE